MAATYPDSTDLLTIESTYCGPASSAHGGVTVGRLTHLVEGPSEVRLLAPPPLGVALTPQTTDDGTVVVSGPDGDVARVRPVDEPVEVAPFAPVPERDVEAAAREYLDRVAAHGHPFPTCVGCGPDRRDDDALRQFTGRAGDDGTVTRFRVHGEGRLPDWLAIAGLDCPSGQTVSTLADPTPEAVVLGAMRCRLHAGVSAGVDYQVRGRLLSADGRRYTTEVAMLDPDGSMVASARAVWIAVDPARFGT